MLKAHLGSKPGNTSLTWAYEADMGIPSFTFPFPLEIGLGILDIFFFKLFFKVCHKNWHIWHGFLRNHPTLSMFWVGFISTSELCSLLRMRQEVWDDLCPLDVVFLQFNKSSWWALSESWNLRLSWYLAEDDRLLKDNFTWHSRGQSCSHFIFRDCLLVLAFQDHYFPSRWHLLILKQILSLKASHCHW